MRWAHPILSSCTHHNRLGRWHTVQMSLHWHYFCRLEKNELMNVMDKMMSFLYFARTCLFRNSQMIDLECSKKPNPCTCDDDNSKICRLTIFAANDMRSNLQFFFHVLLLPTRFRSRAQTDKSTDKINKCVNRFKPDKEEMKINNCVNWLLKILWQFGWSEEFQLKLKLWKSTFEQITKA